MKRKESPRVYAGEYVKEYQLATFEQNSIPESVGQKIYHNYGKEIEI
ncbi:hypothetical protein [Microcoleus sp. EPA2]